MEKLFRNFIVILVVYLFVFSLSVLDFSRLKTNSASAEEVSITVEFDGVSTPYIDFSTAFSAALDCSSSEDNFAVVTLPYSVSAYGLTVAVNKYIRIQGSSPEVKITRSGGGVNLFIVYGNLILENITLDGGAVYTYNGEIVDYPYPNSSYTGKATKSLIQVYAGGKLVLNTGATVQNCARNGKGAAILLNGGNLDLSGGRITANRGENGAAVYMQSNAVFTLNSGTIENNYATVNGGAIYNSASTLNLFGGSVTNNITTSEGAIYSYLTAITYLSKNPIVCGNKNESEEPNNIFATTALEIYEDLSFGSCLGISTQSNDTLFLSGATESYIDYFFSDDEKKEVNLFEGNLKLKDKITFATVSFITYAEAPLEDIFIYNEEAKITAPSIEKTGYILDGWYNGDVKWNFDDFVTVDITLTAKWILKAPTVSNILCESAECEEIDINANKDIKAITVISSHEIGWVEFEYVWQKNGEEYSKASSLSITSKADQGFYEVKVCACLGEEKSEFALSNSITVKTYYTVDFFDNEENLSEQKVYEEYAPEPSVLQKPGFDFIGWKTAEDNEEIWDFDNNKIESNLVFIVCWKLGSPTIVSFESDKDKDTTLEGEQLTLRAIFTHILTGDWTYKWYKNNKIIEGEQTNTITVLNPDESGEYFCEANFTFKEQTASEKTCSLTVFVLKRKLTAEVFDEEKSEGLSATLETDIGIDPQANLFIEETDKNQFAYELAVDEEIDIVYSIELKKQEELVSLPQSSTFSLSLDIANESNKVAKIILIKSDKTWEEIQTTTRDGKLIFTTDSLGSIMVISNTNTEVSNPQTSDEGTQNNDIDSDENLNSGNEVLASNPSNNNNLAPGSEQETEVKSDFQSFVFPFITIFILLLLVIIILKLKRKGNLKI